MDGCPVEISVLPLNRVLNYSKTQEMMLFPFTRVPYREQNYKWIGPIMVDSFVFAVLSSEKRAFKSIEDFKGLPVGANSSTPTSRRLQALGFDKVQNVAAEKFNARKLIVGHRIDAWFCPHLILRYTIEMGDLDEDRVRIAYKDMDVEMYIAASPEVPDEIVDRW